MGPAPRGQPADRLCSPDVDRGRCFGRGGSTKAQWESADANPRLPFARHIGLDVKSLNAADTGFTAVILHSPALLATGMPNQLVTPATPQEARAALITQSTEAQTVSRGP